MLPRDCATRRMMAKSGGLSPRSNSPNGRQTARFVTLSPWICVKTRIVRDRQGEGGAGSVGACPLGTQPSASRGQQRDQRVSRQSGDQPCPREEAADALVRRGGASVKRRCAATRSTAAYDGGRAIPLRPPSQPQSQLDADVLRNFGRRRSLHLGLLPHHGISGGCTICRG